MARAHRVPGQQSASAVQTWPEALQVAHVPNGVSSGSVVHRVPVQQAGLAT
jgi:hypothetical protein